MLFSLFKYEWRKMKVETIVFMAVVFLLNAYAFYKLFANQAALNIGTDADFKMATSLGIGLNMLTIPIVSILPIISYYRSFSQEFKDNTIYLMMSLPVTSQKKLLVKQLASLSQYLFLMLFVGIFVAIHSLVLINTLDIYSLYLAQKAQIMEVIYEVLPELVLLFICHLLFIVTVFNIILLASVIGKTFRKYYRVISVVSLIGIVYIVIKLFDFFSRLNLFISTSTDGVLPLLGFGGALAIISIGLFFASTTLYEKKIQL